VPGPPNLMTTQIAIPEPTSLDADYNLRTLAPYLFAIQSAGGTPIVVPLHESPGRVARILGCVQGILLPGSRYDVEPERYGEERGPLCGESDPARTAVDELLLQDAFNLHKPILAICHGLQSMNVWLDGTLVQHLATEVDHRPVTGESPGHSVHLAPGSRLAALAAPHSASLPASADGGTWREIQVNSSHHQAIRKVGDNLLVTAISPADQGVEGVELDSLEQFVVGVQWHPERTYTVNPLSRALFAAFIRAAEGWLPPLIDESIYDPQTDR